MMQETQSRHNIRVAVLTLGCKVNKYESDSMKEKLLLAGFTLVEPQAVADFYIVNTCSVTNIAQKKSRQMLRRVKRKNPRAYVIAAGCYVNAEHDELLKENYVDIVVGNNCKKDIVKVIHDFMKDHGKTSCYTEIGTERDYEEMGSLNASHLDHQRAYVKIQDGCNQFCSYCIIPYTRGRVRSRRPEHILEEIEALAKEGVKEFVLTGIHISSYGVDFGNQSQSKGDYLCREKANPDAGEAVANLGELVLRIAEIPDVKRIRLGSLEPRIITEEFLKQIDSDKLCPHFHLSLQSACNATLKRMNRRYTIEEFEDKCRMIREHFEKPAITTDVIVGFPGESEEEFAITKANLERLGLYEIHVFKYSKRAGTAAEGFADQVPESVKNERSGILLSMTARQKEEYEKSVTGLLEEVLIEERADGMGLEHIYRVSKQKTGMYFLGHTKRYVKVCLEAEGDITNEIIKITM